MFINKPNNIPNTAESIVEGLTVTLAEKSYTESFESKLHIISTVLIVTVKNVLIKFILEKVILEYILMIIKRN